MKEQPDLNWRNPEVKNAMWEAVRFWLDLGVDGYRLDAIGTIFENPELPDQRSNLTEGEMRQLFKRGFPDRPDKKLIEVWESIYKEQVEQDGVHELMQELRRVVDEYPQRVLVGENHDVKYYGDGTNELHLTFNFPLMRTDRLTPDWIRANQAERLASLPLGAWPCNTLNNHDSSRVYNRYGNSQHDDAIARTSLALMLTLRGTPFLYNGEEIGMSDYYLDQLELFRDPPAVLYYAARLADGISPAEALEIAGSYSRDRCRTPMQWSHAPNAGFSPAGVQTWLPINPNYAQGVNVADQQNDPDSMLNFYKRMLQVRKQTPALIEGDFQPLNETSNHYFAFLRRSSEQTCLVILNLSDQPHTLGFEFQSKETPSTFFVSCFSR